MSRRADGALETAVLRVLWDADEPQSPAQVRGSLTADLAYTSVATVLNRLCAKGLVSRQRSGRRYLYAATSTEADLAGQRIHTLLDAAGDRAAVLAGFLRTLSADDADMLRELLGD